MIRFFVLLHASNFHSKNGEKQILLEASFSLASACLYHTEIKCEKGKDNDSIKVFSEYTL
jgi:hypothetical protein